MVASHVEQQRAQVHPCHPQVAHGQNAGARRPQQQQGQHNAAHAALRQQRVRRMVSSERLQLQSRTALRAGGPGLED